MNRQSRAFLSAQASSILRMIGGRDEVVLIPEDSRIRAGMVDDVYAEMWPELLAPCLKSLGLERAGWIDYLFMVGLQQENPQEIDARSEYAQSVREMSAWLVARGIDTARLSGELTASYIASAAALLPCFRQRQLDCTFDLQAGRVAFGSRADYSPAGQRSFFMIVQRLLLQRLLRQRGLRFPLFITRQLDPLDADWRFAIWKLVISAADPLVVIVPDCQPGGDTDALLHRIDWSYPTDYPYFGLTETCGAIELEPLGEPTRAWLNDPPHN